ncbi:MAG: hypothetical protein ACFFCI_22615 [Promethearchaeota archaeon]
MEKSIIKHLEDALDNFLDDLEAKMVNFLNRFSDQEEETMSEPLDNALDVIDLNIYDYSNLKVSKGQFLNNFREVLGRAKHKIMLTVPRITDLEDLELYNIRSSVNMSISCYVDIGMTAHLDLIEEFDNFENIEIRNYKYQDRWAILRDNEELLFAAIGTRESNLLFIHTEDKTHVETLGILTKDPWIRSKNFTFILK